MASTTNKSLMQEYWMRWDYKTRNIVSNLMDTCQTEAFTMMKRATSSNIVMMRSGKKYPCVRSAVCAWFQWNGLDHNRKCENAMNRECHEEEIGNSIVCTIDGQRSSRRSLFPHKWNESIKEVLREWQGLDGGIMENYVLFMSTMNTPGDRHLRMLWTW